MYTMYYNSVINTMISQLRLSYSKEYIYYIYTHFIHLIACNQIISSTFSCFQIFKFIYNHFKSVNY